MKDLEEIKEIIKQHRNIIADKYGVAIVGIFGSYVRGEQEQRSDIDLLADILRRPEGLWGRGYNLTFLV